jgi:hypothetical protein
VITRFYELGVVIYRGEISFSPVLLKRSEFLSEPTTWKYSVGGDLQSESLEAGSLAFTLCGIPVIYRLAQESGIQVYSDSNSPALIPGTRLGAKLSQSLFKRENHIKKVVVNLPTDKLRHE